MHTVEHIVFQSMGIPVHLTLVGVSAEQAASLGREVASVFGEWDRTFSRFKPESELARMNSRSGEWVVVSGGMLSVIGRCLALARETNGVFDPSVGGYLAAAGYGLPRSHRLPVPVPDFRSIELDEHGRRIRCAPGQILEPAAIVKGMAIDAGGRVLETIDGWMINAGGDVLTHGAFPGQDAWHVAIQHPVLREAIVQTVRIRDEAIATSGDYENVWRSGGQQWHHQIDMHTGRPVLHSASVSVISRDAQHADTLASILFLLGRDEARMYARSHGVPYLFIDHDGRLECDDAWSRRVLGAD